MANETKPFKFTRGTACDGNDYNPGDIGVIPATWATIFEAQQRGTILTPEEYEAALKPATETKGGSDNKSKK